MAKYYKHIEMIDGAKVTKCFIPEGVEMCIPEADGNSDYQRIMADPDLEIIEVDDTIE